MSYNKPHNSEDLSFDQSLVGIWSYLKGNYKFKTDLVESTFYEVQFVTDSDSHLLSKIQLFRQDNLLIEFVIEQKNILNKNSLEFSISKFSQFEFLHFCILFKYFYQYLTQQLSYDYLLLRSDRYDSYAFKKYLGFKKIKSPYEKSDLLLFDLQHGLQIIWDEFYGSPLEYNLHHFLLPIESGGYAPSNIKLRKTHENIEIERSYQRTEKRIVDTTEPLAANLKIGYQNITALVKDLSEKGIRLSFSSDDINHIKKDNTYTIWIHDEELNIKWSQLSVQVLWLKETECGCHILDKTIHWRRFVNEMSLRENQRLTFLKLVP